jgi:hypothetical protein
VAAEQAAAAAPRAAAAQSVATDCGTHETLLKLSASWVLPPKRHYAVGCRRLCGGQGSMQCGSGSGCDGPQFCKPFVLGFAALLLLPCLYTSVLPRLSAWLAVTVCCCLSQLSPHPLKATHAGVDTRGKAQQR